MVTVRLSQVPEELRRQAADLLIKKMGLTSFVAIGLTLAAADPRQDPEITVSLEKAVMVLEKGRFPKGPLPVFE